MASLTAKHHSSPSASQVRVVLRVRPFLPSEIEPEAKNPNPCITVVNPADRSREEVTVRLKDQWTSRNECYKLDSFFGQEDSVYQIFQQEVCSMIPEIFQGLNATVFAYGATGSGKTYTMQGTLEEPGLIPLALSTILSLCDGPQCSVEIAYYEVYMERCYDLLEPKTKEILALEGKDGHVQLKGLSWIPVHSMDEFSQVFSIGIQRRKVAHTGLNDVSSRSHGVLSIAITNAYVKGKLNLIDLAGNEDNRRTGNKGIRLQESAKINQSLFALSNVIYALNNNEIRVPYRASKLTRILQDSLGGTSRALMIACLNPTSYQEAVHTVSLAARSRKIVNYIGVDNGKETPRVKVDMEAKLRAWLESKGKTKSIQRRNGPCTPLVGKTPASSNCHMKTGSIHSSVKAKTNSCDVYGIKGSKPFDSSTPILSAVEKTWLHLEEAARVQDNHSENYSSPRHFFQFQQSNIVPPVNGRDDDKVKGGAARVLTTDSSDSELNQLTLESSAAKRAGSPQIWNRSQRFPNSPRKALSPIPNNITPIKNLPETITSDKDEGGVHDTPLNKFNASSSNLKESLVQEYLGFLNVASKEELMQLKGIGHKRAEYILKLRELTPKPLKSLSDLEKIGLSSKQVHDIFRRTAREIFA